MPSKITLSVADPDELIITFKKPLIFMDSENFTQLEEDLAIPTKI